MKKNLFALAFVLALISLLTLSPALAAGKSGQAGKSNLLNESPTPKPGKSGQAGKSNVGHLYLYEKDPADWTIVDGGAWGKMKYNLSGSEFDFVFNGHELPIGVQYALIYYPDPWPGAGLIILGDGIVNEGGDVHIKGKINTGDLPAETDDNFDNGAKIWLVLYSDLGGIEPDVLYSDLGDIEPELMMTGWNPTDYLFEYELINFDGTP